MNIVSAVILITAALAAVSNVSAAQCSDWAPEPAMQKAAIKREVERREHVAVSDVDIAATGQAIVRFDRGSATVLFRFDDWRTACFSGTDEQRKEQFQENPLGLVVTSYKSTH